MFSEKTTGMNKQNFGVYIFGGIFIGVMFSLMMGALSNGLFFELAGTTIAASLIVLFLIWYSKQDY